MQRPQEMFNTHAIASMVRAINKLGAAPLTGEAPQIVAMTGDSVDNTQRNELTNFLALFDGGMVRPDSGAPGYDGVQRPDWPGDIYWKPDGADGADLLQSGLGFPRRPGVLDSAAIPVSAGGDGALPRASQETHRPGKESAGITRQLTAGIGGYAQPSVPRGFR